MNTAIIIGIIAMGAVGLMARRAPARAAAPDTRHYTADQPSGLPVVRRSINTAPMPDAGTPTITSTPVAMPQPVQRPALDTLTDPLSSPELIWLADPLGLAPAVIPPRRSGGYM